MIGQLYSTRDVVYGQYNWLRREFGRKLNYPADHELMNRTQRNYVDTTIERGIHCFCEASWPMLPRQALSGEGREGGIEVDSIKEDKRKAPHRWSFLNRTHTFSTVSGTQEYPLPADYGGIINEPTTSREGGRIAITTEKYIRQLTAAEGLTGNATYCALRQNEMPGAEADKPDLLLYPTPDGTETISIEYRANPAALSSLKQHPPGGVQHAETILACVCYVRAIDTGEKIAEAVRYLQERLMASIYIDRASDKPTTDGIWVDDDGRFNVAYLSRFIGRHIGAGPNPKVWSHQQEQLIAEAIRRAIRMVVNPPVMPGKEYPHAWRFLQPSTVMTTDPAVWEYDLPNDFVEIIGQITFDDAQSVFYSPITVTSRTRLRNNLQRQDASTRPTLAAVEPKHDNTFGTKWKLLLWPVPDSEYKLRFQYRVNPNTSGYNTLPAIVDNLDLHGGDRFSEMYLEAGMLAADRLLEKPRSVHYDRFHEAVRSAVGQDLLTAAPDNVGYNSDPSATLGRGVDGLDYHELDANTVTVNGNTYT